MDDERGSALRAGGSDGGAAKAGGIGPSGGAEGIIYPVEFELRVIYVLAEGRTLAAELRRVLAERGARPGEPRTLPAIAGAPEGKYGRMGCRVTFADKESMYSTYAAVGALAGVKAVL